MVYSFNCWGFSHSWKAGFGGTVGIVSLFCAKTKFTVVNNIIVLQSLDKKNRIKGLNNGNQFNVFAKAGSLYLPQI